MGGGGRSGEDLPHPGQPDGCRLRLRHPRLGDVYPDQFIRVAEQNGLIEDLTDPVGAAVIASRLDASIGVPHHLDGITVTTSASIGKALVFFAVVIFLQFRPNGLVTFRTRGLTA